MKTGWETEEFTPGLKAGAWESSAVMPTHTEFQTGVESVKNRRNSLVCKRLILQTGRGGAVLIMLEEREKVATIVTIIPHTLKRPEERKWSEAL